ncbi:MAG: SufD family Fe-S cluster assembly protein [Bauldia sp.]|nr:SufD family Fe-S cluster assembly protein [Bauldia sp.]
MSAEPRVMKTEAEQAIAAQYRDARAALPGTAAALAKRDDAMALFERAGLPHRRIEAWKYTDLRAQMRRAAPLAEAPALADAAKAAAADRLAGLDRYRLVIVDGRYQEDLSQRMALLAEGVEVATFAEFVGFDFPAAAAILEPPAAAADDAMLALNAALATDGVVVLVAENARPSKPIEIAHVTTGAVPASWHARSAVTIGKGAEARLIVSHSGPDAIAYQATTSTALTVADGARAKLAVVQTEGDAAQLVATLSARIGVDAAFDLLAVNAGAKLSRLQGFLSIAGEGARVGIAAATMLADGAHGDVAVTIDHEVPAATSRVLVKNAVGTDATGALQGKIIVRPDAQKTDGRMMIRSLLLAETAEFAAKPELEIYADDVQCGHGATSGQIDEDMLFYLLARGIPRAEAEGLLLTAFLSEAVEALGDEEIAAAIEPLVAGWLGKRGARIARSAA